MLSSNVIATPHPPRVLHFVTGGFSGGATQVAIALVRAALVNADSEPLLVLRRKSHTDAGRVEELRREGLPMRVVPGVLHLLTIFALVRVCRQFKPDILVAHGYSEHLWGRYAALLAGVPHCVHVEHNTRERYNAWRLIQSRWLAKRTDRIVGCSEGVRQVLLGQGMPASRTIAIGNGIGLAPFARAEAYPWEARKFSVVMVARLARQKDHATLIRATAMLRQRGIELDVLLVGGGKPRFRARLQALAMECGVQDLVVFAGVRRDVPDLLMQHRFAVLSTHYEGMPLAVLEGMAAGCAVIASAVPGVQEVLRDGIDGRLFKAGDAESLCETLQQLIDDSASAKALASAARQRAQGEFSREVMAARYQKLYEDVMEGR